MEHICIGDAMTPIDYPDCLGIEAKVLDQDKTKTRMSFSGNVVDILEYMYLVCFGAYRLSTGLYL